MNVGRRKEPPNSVLSLLSPLFFRISSSLPLLSRDTERHRWLSHIGATLVGQTPQKYERLWANTKKVKASLDTRSLHR